MRLKITHRTEYSYDAPVAYALQRLRLIPYGGTTQTIRLWDLTIEGATEQVRFTDQFANETLLISVEGGSQAVAVEAVGEVETHETSGVTGKHRGFAPIWLFRQETPLTEAGEGVRGIADGISGGAELERLHELMAAIGDRVAYRKGATVVTTTAEQALAEGNGVCQDHAHIFISAARHLGMPARYVSGYMMVDAAEKQAASHAWAEAHVPSLGWVGFDVANCICPDERYVRLATGRDYRDAAPVTGIRLGAAEEHLAVAITVEQ